MPPKPPHMINQAQPEPIKKAAGRNERICYHRARSTAPHIYLQTISVSVCVAKKYIRNRKKIYAILL